MERVTIWKCSVIPVVEVGVIVLLIVKEEAYAKIGPAVPLLLKTSEHETLGWLYRIFMFMITIWSAF